MKISFLSDMCISVLVLWRIYYYPNTRRFFFAIVRKVNVGKMPLTITVSRSGWQLNLLTSPAGDVSGNDNFDAYWCLLQ